MSMHSVDDFDPTSSTVVFGGTVSQTKIQQQQQSANDLGGAEKLITPPQPTVNGQNDTTNNKNSDNLGNGTTSTVTGNNGTTDSTNAHVNGQNDQSVVGTLPSTNTTTTEGSVSVSGTSDSAEKSSQNDPLRLSAHESTSSAASTAPPPVDPPAPVEPGPELSTPADVVNRDLTSAPATVADNAPPVPALSTEPTTSTSNENVPASATAPEATVLAESATPERKSKSPRGKAKSPVVSTPPTRQSTRAKKTVSSLSITEDEKPANEDTGASTTSQNQSSPSPKRAKRQAATKAKDAIEASNQPTSTTEEEVNDPADQDAIISDVDEDDYVKEGKTKKKTPSPLKGGGRGPTNAGRKRGASSSPSVSPSKKTKTTPKGKQSTTLNDEQQMDVGNTQGNETTPTTTTATVPTAIATSENEPAQTPPKKARTSGNRKTPTSATPPESSGEYVRKLRPRK